MSVVLLDVRIIGVIEAKQTQKTARLKPTIGCWRCRFIPTNMSNITSLEELNPAILDQLEQFFVSYNKLRGKKFKLKNQGWPQARDGDHRKRD